MGDENGLQVVDRFGGQPHEQGRLVLLPIVAVLGCQQVLVLGHRFVTWRMTTVNPAEARP
jgi:hypothetical protein